MEEEVEVLTETKKRLLAKKCARALTPSKAYALDTIASSASVLAECGGQAVLVFRAIIGSYGISQDEKRQQGFTIHRDFVRATNLEDRQFRRAVSRLARASFIEADSAPGRRPRIRLTSKGARALVEPIQKVSSRTAKTW